MCACSSSRVDLIGAFSGVFPNFGVALSLFLRKYSAWIAIALLASSFFPASEKLLLGNGGVKMLSPIALPVFFLACGLVSFSWVLVDLFLSTATFTNHRADSTDNFGVDRTRSLRRSLLHIAVVSTLIWIIIPYQVVFLICFIIHWITCWSSYRKSDDCKSSKEKNANAFNQNAHVLMLLLWLLPIKAPSLAVWVRTIATARSISLFDSDHWPHPVLPFLILTEFANARSPALAFAPAHNRSIYFTNLYAT